MKLPFNIPTQLVIIIPIVALIIAVGVIIFLFLNKKKEPDEVEESSDADEVEVEIEEDGVMYDRIDDMFEQSGFVRFHLGGLIEFEDDQFALVAEMGASNPSLKSGTEEENENAMFETYIHTSKQVRIHSQTRKFDITEHNRLLKKSCEEDPDSTPEMRKFGQNIIEDMNKFQQSSDRFENVCFLVLRAEVDRETLYADTEFELDELVKEKAFEALLRSMRQANGLLKKAGHPLKILDEGAVLELVYISLNKKRSMKLRFFDMLQNQTFAPYISAKQDDRLLKIVTEKIQIEEEIQAEVESRSKKVWERSMARITKEYLDDPNKQSSLVSDKKQYSIEFKD